MRICLYTNTAFPALGGQEVVVDELARQYQALGHEVLVFCPEPPSGLHANDKRLPYPVERHARFVSTRWFVDWYELALKRVYRKFKYDVIHCHNLYPNGYLAVQQKLRGGPPVIITSHGGDVREDNPRFRKPGLLLRHRLAVQGADALVSISSFTQQGFLRLGAKPYAIRGIPNGVHVQEYAQAEARPDSLPSHIKGDRYHLFLGRLAHRKGVDVLLRAAALQSQEASPDARLAHLVIGGDGQERKSLEQLSQQLGISNRVTFMGSVQGKIKKWLLQNALSLVIPTREWEAFPMVLLEGYASGCPVIASDAPGLSSLVAHEESGWVIPRNDPVALKEQLKLTEHYVQTSKALGRAGQRIAQSHDWRSIAERHLALFDELAVQAHFPLRLVA